MDEELKSVKFVIDGEEINAVVIGMERDVGITLAEEGNEKRLLLCVVGPATWAQKDEKKTADYYHVFDRLKERLAGGMIIINGDDGLGLGYQELEQAELQSLCPFGR